MEILHNQLKGLIKKNDYNVKFFNNYVIRGSAYPIHWLIETAQPASARLYKTILKIEDELFALNFVLNKIIESKVPNVDHKCRKALLNLKRALKKRKSFKIDKSAIGNSLTLDEFKKIRYFLLLEKKKNIYLNRFSKNLDFEIDAARKNLKEICKKDEFAEGIFLSRQEMYQGMLRYVKDRKEEESNSTKRQNQIERSLFLHLARACTKSATRGLLTGVAQNKVGEQCEQGKKIISNLPVSIVRRKSRVSYNVVNLIAKKVSELPGIWEYLCPRLNPYLVKRGSYYEFVIANKKGVNSTYNVEENDLLNLFLKLIETKNEVSSEIITEICKVTAKDYEAIDLKRYFLNLIESGIIFCSMKAPIDELEPLDWLISKITSIIELGYCNKDIDNILNSVISIKSELKKIDNRNINFTDNVETYNEISKLIENLVPKTKDWHIDRILLVTCETYGNNYFLSKGTLKICSDVMQFLLKIQEIRKKSLKPMNDYAYLLLKEVGLVSENEKRKIISYHDLQFIEVDTSKFKKENISRTGWDFFFELIDPFLKDKSILSSQTLDLKNMNLGAPLDKLRVNCNNKLEDGSAVLEVSCYEDENFVQNVVLDNILLNWGPLLRYLNFFESNDLRDELKSNFKFLKNAINCNKLIVDILASYGRVDDVTQYYSITDYSILFPTTLSKKNREALISLSKIFLKIENQKVFLITMLDGVEKELAPIYLSYSRPSKAHLVDEIIFTLGMFLTYPPNKVPSWKLRENNHIPRVTYGKFILEREKWFFPIKKLYSEENLPKHELFKKWNFFIYQNNIPRFVFVTNYSKKPIYVDFNNFFSLSALEKYIGSMWKKSRDCEVVFSEMLPNPFDIIRTEKSSKVAYKTQFQIAYCWS